MTGTKLVAMVAAVVAVVGVTAAVYVYRQQHPVSPSAEGTVATGESPAPAAEPAKPQSESTSEAVVPSFDVVRIEPSGEGVIAGRAEPGWHVSVEDSGSKVAEAIADEEGAWSVVLEKPLPGGEQSLSITAVSPDGARSLISQQSVAVVVGKSETTVAATTEPEKSGEPTSPSGAPAEASGFAPTAEPAPTEALASQASESHVMPTPEAAAPAGLPESSAQGEPSSGTESAAPPPTAEQRKEPMPEAKIQPAAPQQAAPAGPAAPAPAAEAKPSPAPRAVSPQGTSQMAPPQAASSQPAAAEASKPAPVPRAHRTKHRPRVYTVRHGDTLWAIAERYFGGGWHYVTIYRDNRKQIHNPHRIYPKQKVDLPKN